MTAKRGAPSEKKIVKISGEAETLKPELKCIGGSQSDDWNNVLANQTANSLWLANSSDETQRKQRRASLAALIGIAPKDELEAMLAAQMLAAHHASMECYRRAMIGEQTFEERRENVNQANKLSRTYATLVEALNRHRGKGQQKVTVEHVHVHAGGRAVVGMVETPGEGIERNQRINPMQKSLPMHLSPRCGARTRKGKRKGNQCKSPAMPNGRCRMHGGTSPGAPKGNRNAWKHGHYSAESIAFRRIVRRLLSDAADLAKRC